MKSQTLLEIANNIMIACRLPALEYVIGNTSLNARTVLLAINRAMDQDAGPYAQWSFLRREFTISFTGTDSPYPLPEDYDSHINQTAWDIVNRRPAVGPMLPYAWEKTVRQNLTSPNVQMYFTKRNERIGIGGGDPTPSEYQEKPCFVFFPTQPESVREEGSFLVPFDAFVIAYVHNWYVADAGDRAPKRKFEADDDLTVIPADIVVAAGVYRMKMELKIPYKDEEAEMRRLLRDRASKDLAGNPFSMNTWRGRWLNAYPNLGPNFATVPHHGTWGW